MDLADANRTSIWLWLAKTRLICEFFPISRSLRSQY
jgi:hypothetical protein